MATKGELLRGQTSNLPAEVIDGRLLFTTDGGRIYLDNGTERVEFYKKDIEKSTCNNYDAVLEVGNWTGAGGGTFTYDYRNSAIRANHPPLITCTDNDKSNYSLITRADATAGTGIIFIASSKPKADVNLIVVDLG